MNPNQHMLLALILATSLAQCVPARWFTDDPSSLELLENHPINCLLLESVHWSSSFCVRAHEKGRNVLAVIRPGQPLVERIRQAKQLGFDGIVLEGRFGANERDQARSLASELGLQFVLIGARHEMDLTGRDPVIGTFQTVWPGIHLAEDGAAKAAPTGAPWIDSNGGFIRYVRSLTPSAIWLSGRPPRQAVVPLIRYLQAIHDSAVVGAWWVLELDDDFRQRLLAGSTSGLEDWRRLGEHIRYWLEHAEWRDYEPYGQFGLIHDRADGALLQGGIIDMLVARHIPLRVIPPARLSADVFRGLRMVLNVNPTSLTQEQRDILRQFTRGGGTLLSAPPGWQLSDASGENFVASDKEVEVLDSVWRGVNGLIGRENLGVRLFNVSSIRSVPVASRTGRPVVLHLVNYADYPVERVTCRFQERFTRATLLAPGRSPSPLELVTENGGSEVLIDKVDVLVSVLLE